MSSTCCGPSCSQYPVPSRQFPDCHPERNTRKEVPTRFCCGSGGCEVEGSAVVFDDVTDPVNCRSFDSARVRQWRTRAALRMTAIKGCSTLATDYWLLATASRLLPTGSFLLATGYWLLATGCCILGGLYHLTVIPSVMSDKRRLRVWRIRLLMFLAVIGPGFITANVDNDAGGIYTYSAAGAQFGYLLLWVMIPMTVALVVVQEMSARMGAATGKGLSDLIREEYGLRITFFMMLGLVITNFGNVVAEFAGIASSLELFHISRYVSVPVAAVVVWLLVVKGTYKSVEKVFLAASFFYFAYIIAGVLAGPSWKEAFVATFKPPHSGAFHQSAYIYMVIAVVGTTIAPWMQFYLQSSIVEKGITPREYRASRWDVILGCLFTDIVAWFIVVACGKSATAPMPPRHCALWRASMPISSLPRGCSTLRSSPLPFCRSRRPTRCAKAWVLNQV